MKKNVKECEDLFELAGYLNEYVRQNPEDDCLDIVKEACAANNASWTYTDDVEGYYDSDFVTDGMHVLYLSENGTFDTRLDEHSDVVDLADAIPGSLEYEIIKTGFRYIDNEDGTYDVCYDHAQDSWFSAINKHHVATVREDDTTWYIEGEYDLCEGEYPKNDWTFADALKNQCGEY